MQCFSRRSKNEPEYLYEAKSQTNHTLNHGYKNFCISNTLFKIKLEP